MWKDELPKGILCNGFSGNYSTAHHPEGTLPVHNMEGHLAGMTILHPMFLHCILFVTKIWNYNNTSIR
jgi:hypothetical protein